MFKKIVAFHISYEFKRERTALLQMLQQTKSSLGKICSLFIFRAIAHNSHLRHLFAVNRTRQNAGHNGIPYQMPGLGIRVGSGISHIADSEFIRKLGHNARTFHTIQQPQFDGGSRYSRPRIARADHGIRISGLDQIHGNGHG